MILNPDPEDLSPTEDLPESIDEQREPDQDAVDTNESHTEAAEPSALSPGDEGEAPTDLALEKSDTQTDPSPDESDAAADHNPEGSENQDDNLAKPDAPDQDADDEADVTFDGNRPIVQELQYKTPKAKGAGEDDEPADDELKFSTVAEAKAVVEGFLFSSNEPLSVARLSKLMGDLHPKTVRGLLLELQWDYENRPGALQVIEIAGGYLLSTRPYVAPWMFRLHKLKRRSPLSPATLETLAIIAYRQPITKGEIEGIRGVETGAPLRTLQELNLIEARGRREVVGRPQLYVTTDHFLKVFALNSLAELPSISELKSRFAEEQRLKTAVKKPADETAQEEPAAEESADAPNSNETVAASEEDAKATEQPGNDPDREDEASDLSEDASEMDSGEEMAHDDGLSEEGLSNEASIEADADTDYEESSDDPENPANEVEGVEQDESTDSEQKPGSE